MADSEESRTTEAENTSTTNIEAVNQNNGAMNYRGQTFGINPSGFTFCRPELQRTVLGPSLFAQSSASTVDSAFSSVKPVLRPSQLAPSVPDPKSGSLFSQLRPSALSTPFNKGPVALHTSIQKTSSQPENKNEEVGVTAPRFVPLGTPAHQKDDGQCSSSTTAGSSGNVPTVTSMASSFVFGQNLHERVTVESSASEQAAGPSEGAAVPESTHTPVATTNGTAEMLFTSVIKKDKIPQPAEGNKENGDPPKSLSEAAREYEEARAVKRKYDEVTVLTGEEGEVNILQINCKLFAFDKTNSSWKERGRGTLRLNDFDSPEGSQSRLVMRVTGSLRVLLNTKIWAEMSVDRPSQRSIRLTAQEANGEVKVFLVMASPSEMDQLHRCLRSRVATQVAREPKTRKRQSTESSLNSSREYEASGGAAVPSEDSELESHDVPSGKDVPTIVVQKEIGMDAQQV